LLALFVSLFASCATAKINVVESQPTSTITMSNGFTMYNIDGKAPSKQPSGLFSRTYIVPAGTHTISVQQTNSILLKNVKGTITHNFLANKTYKVVKKNSFSVANADAFELVEK